MVIWSGRYYNPAVDINSSEFKYNEGGYYKPGEVVEDRVSFGKADVVGEIISIQSFSGANQDVVITGVLKEIP